MSKIERQSVVNVNILDKQMAVLSERFDTLEDKLDDILKILDKLPGVYATKEELKPLQRFVMGMQGAGVLILMGVLGLLIAHVIPGFKL